MSLQQELEKVHQSILTSMPDVAKILDEDTEARMQEGIGGDAIQIGQPVPVFTLPDQLNRDVNSSELIKEGPVVISFYRGSWCPYCSLELHALQASLDDIVARGANLVAISPQLPDESLNTAEKYELKFPVLSDVGNKVARQFGLVFTLSEHIRPIYKSAGVDLPASNGTDTFELPVPGTFIINKQGVISAEFVNADYKQRMDPNEILKELDKIQ